MTHREISLGVFGVGEPEEIKSVTLRSGGALNHMTQNNARVWSSYQNAIFKDMSEGKGNTVIRAYAGCAKTSTCVEGLIRLPSNLQIIVMAFNTGIRDELTAFLKDYGKNSAEHYFNHWLELCVKIPHSVIKAGMEIKLENKKEKLSYIDCIGYSFSLQNKLFFLTGDSKFKNKPGVEFVK